jgi:hypothetical protein
MSGDWAWKEADCIASDPGTHGTMLVPLVLGSDKTTVSVATGQNEYYPLYLSIGNVRNNVRCAHRNAVVILGFLAIPKSKCLLNGWSKCLLSLSQWTSDILGTRNSVSSADNSSTHLSCVSSTASDWQCSHLKLHGHPMVTTAASSTASGPILQTTLNRPS